VAATVELARPELDDLPAPARALDASLAGEWLRRSTTTIPKPGRRAAPKQ
jgi:hypothetical protein